MSKPLSYECCCVCDSHTGRAGRSDDSLFLDTGRGELGPLCEECYNALRRDDLLEEITVLRAQLAEKYAEILRLRSNMARENYT